MYRLEKMTIAKFEMRENWFILICQGSSLGVNQIINKVFSPKKSYCKIRIWSTNVQTRCNWKPWGANLRNFEATETFATFHRGTAFTFASGFVGDSTIHTICGYIIAAGQITHRIPAISNWNLFFSVQKWMVRSQIFWS